MKRETKRELRPKLRFPEFLDAGEWEEREIGKVLFEKPRPINIDDVEDYSLVIVKRRYGGVVSRGILKGYAIKVRSQFLLQENDFVISKRQIVHCACGLVPKALEGSIVSNEYSVLRARYGLDISFFNYFSQQPAVSQSFLRCSAGIVIEKMLFKLNDWLKREFLFPSLPEQQRIADCLSSIDELITAQTQKLDALKAHKKGQMQQLFPAEGETLPKLRFPEFRDAGEWVEVKLIDMADKKIKWSFIGGPFGSNLKSSDYLPDGVRIIQLQNIGDAEFLNDYKIFTSEAKANELLANNIYPGEIILSKMGDPVGRACLIPHKHARYVMCSDGIRLVVDENNYSKYYIYTLINSIQFRSLVEKTATGSTRKRIGLDDLKNLPMVVPKKGEQQKIADCLSSLDELITAQTQKLDALKAHKKGLMQQLFPSAES